MKKIQKGNPVPAPVNELFKTAMFAVAHNDNQGFAALLHDEVKPKISKEVLETANSYLAPFVSEGYACSYLFRLHRIEGDYYYWKVTARGSKVKTLAKIAVKDGKVAGFAFV